MTEQARLKGEFGMAPAQDGWYVLHAKDATWLASDGHGTVCRFEGMEPIFEHLGINIRVVNPGVPASLYHSETAQEDFFVLSGECIVIIEEKELRLGPGHFVHCPAGTNHVFVGAGNGPCAILCVGARFADKGLRYPVSEAARKHGASAKAETTEVKEAYGRSPVFYRPVPPLWPLPGE